MKVTKQQLQFISDYVAIVDNTTTIGDKLQIISKIDNKAIFFQRSLDATLIKEVSCPTTGEFNILVNTKMFWNFINSFSETDEIEITPEGFNVGQDKQYTFQSEQNVDEMFNVDEILKTINESKVQESTTLVSFKDFNLLAITNKFIGKDTLQTVGLMKNRMLGTDRFQIVYGDSSFSINENYFLSKPSINILLIHKNLSEIPLYLNDKFYFFEVDGTICIFERNNNYTVPDLFEERPYSRFNQTDSVKVAKSVFYSSLKRMSFFVTDNPAMRIFLTFNDDHILIENRDFNKSFEKIPYLQNNPSLVGVTIIVNCKNLISFMDGLNSEDINIYLNSDENNRSTIRFEDSTENSIKFVHILLKSEK